MDKYVQSPTKKYVLAFVGMPGAGKSIAAQYLRRKNYACVRFGDITERKLRELKLAINPKNEEYIRETLRKEYGMSVYANQSAPKIRELLVTNDTVIIDGLYSWEEYLFLKKEFSFLFLIHIFTDPKTRYERLAKRSIRPFTYEEAKLRDKREIEHLSKGGPIAIANYIIDNSGSIQNLHQKIDILLIKVTNIL